MLSLHMQAAWTYMYDYKPVFRGQTFPSLYSRSSVSWMSVYTWVLPAEPCTTGWPGQISPDTHQWVSLSSPSVPPPPSSVDHTPPLPHPVETVPAQSHSALRDGGRKGYILDSWLYGWPTKTNSGVGGSFCVTHRIEQYSGLWQWTIYSHISL